MTHGGSDEAMKFAPVTDLVAAIAAGRMIVLVDDEDRENEGDLVMAADCVRAEDINFMAREARGLICLALTSGICRKLELPPMVADNRARHRTAFTVSIEAARGVTTGISAFDRAHTIRTAVSGRSRAEDLARPGHVFPLRANDGGVLQRAGHTEAAVDLARLAGRAPAGVIVEILSADGRMARRPELAGFARAHGLAMGSIADLIAHLRTHGAGGPDCYSDPSPGSISSGLLDGMSGNAESAPKKAAPQHSARARASAPASASDAPPTGSAVASPLRCALIASRFNDAIVEKLLTGAQAAFADRNSGRTSVEVFRVPGAWELPLAATHLARSGRFDGIVALGCVVRGETRHYEHIADECARGLMQVQVASGVPVGNGVLAVERIEHAEARALPDAGNKGYQAAMAVLETAGWVAQLS